MFPIIIRELKDRKWSIIAYSLGSLLMLWLYVATFLSSQNSSQQLQELIKTYPKALLDAIGLSDLTLDTVEKYLNAKHFSLLWPILAIILALSRAGRQIAGEVQSGTMGLLLSLPLERIKIFAAKYIVGLVTIIIFTGISVFGVIPLAAAYDIPTHRNILSMAFVLTTLFMWVIYSFGLAVSSTVSESSKVYAISAGILFMSYAAYIVALLDTKFEWLKYGSVFHYFNTQKVLSSGEIETATWLVFGGAIIIFTLFAGWRFSKRDISV